MERGPNAAIDQSNRVALYARVSSEDQDLGGQERELRAEAERRGWATVAVYAEKVSGTGRAVRAQHDHVLEDARRADRPWKHFLVWSLDRFSRAEKFTEATAEILDLEAAGVQFHSLKESTLDTPEDGKPNLGRDVLLALLPVIASFESKRRSERVRVAMREIKEGRRRTRSGRPPGRPRRLTPELTAKVLELRARGLPWNVVAQHAGLPAGTCRKVRPPSQTATGGVEKGPDGFGTPSTAQPSA
ncbi:MAG: recombinase family protein [Thermoplasmata archaeon]